MTYLRFKDLKLGQLFKIRFGGQWAVAQKMEVNKMLVYRCNPRGRDVEVPINPELNEDEVIPL